MLECILLEICVVLWNEFFFCVIKIVGALREKIYKIFLGALSSETKRLKLAFLTYKRLVLSELQKKKKKQSIVDLLRILIEDHYQVYQKKENY